MDLVDNGPAKFRTGIDPQFRFTDRNSITNVYRDPDTELGNRGINLLAIIFQIYVIVTILVEKSKTPGSRKKFLPREKLPAPPIWNPAPGLYILTFSASGCHFVARFRSTDALTPQRIKPLSVRTICALTTVIAVSIIIRIIINLFISLFCLINSANCTLFPQNHPKFDITAIIS